MASLFKASETCAGRDSARTCCAACAALALAKFACVRVWTATSARRPVPPRERAPNLLIASVCRVELHPLARGVSRARGRQTEIIHVLADFYQKINPEYMAGRHDFGLVVDFGRVRFVEVKHVYGAGVVARCSDDVPMPPHELTRCACPRASMLLRLCVPLRALRDPDRVHGPMQSDAGGAHRQRLIRSRMQDRKRGAVEFIMISPLQSAALRAQRRAMPACALRSAVSTASKELARRLIKRWYQM